MLKKMQGVSQEAKRVSKEEHNTVATVELIYREGNNPEQRLSGRATIAVVINDEKFQTMIAGCMSPSELMKSLNHITEAVERTLSQVAEAALED